MKDQLLSTGLSGLDTSCMARLRVLYVEANTRAQIGGSYFSLCYLIQGLDKTRYEPIVLFHQPHQLVSAFEQAGARVLFETENPVAEVNPIGAIDNLKRDLYTLAKRRPWSVVLLTLIQLRAFILRTRPRMERLVALIQQEQPDLVHLNDGITSNHAGILACSRTGVPCIVHERRERTYSPLDRWVARHADAVICKDRAVYEHCLGQGIRVGHIRHILNPIDLSTPVVSSENVRTSLGIPADAPVIAMVGNLLPWKGQRLAIEAFGQVVQDFPHAYFLLIGAPMPLYKDYAESLHLLVRDNGVSDQVIFTGFRNDVRELLAASDIVLYASEDKGVSRVLLDGMSARRPIVAANVAGIDELVTHEVTGLVVQRRPVAVAEAISRLLRDQACAQQMGRQGWQRMKDMCSIERHVAQVEQVYKHVLQKR